MYSANFTLQHVLDCKTGGLVIHQHNEVRDCLGDMAAQVWSQVVPQRLANANTVLHAYVSASVFGGVRTSAVIGFRSPCVD